MCACYAAIVKESLVQKAACSLESVDASYPSNIVGPELSPSIERQTYSEKRKFWEDISKKRESYQRSESEVSGTSQLTTNESDSEYVQQVLTTDTAEIAQQEGKSRTMEDLNVPDISECSVAEKAQYFEEQIQKETTKLAVKLTQQDPVKGMKTRGEDREDAEKCARYMIEAKDVVVRPDDIKQSKQLFVKEEEEKEGQEGVENKEQELVYSERSKAVSIETTNSCTANLSAVKSSKVVNNYGTVRGTVNKVSVELERPMKDDCAESYGAVALVELADIEVTTTKSIKEKLKVEEQRTEASESVHSFDPIFVHKVKETEVNVVQISEIGLTRERSQTVLVSDAADKVIITDRERSTDAQEKLEDVAQIREGVKEPITVDELGKEIAIERDIYEETDTTQRNTMSVSNGAITKEKDRYETKSLTPALVIEKKGIVRTSSVFGKTEVEVVPDEEIKERVSGVSARGPTAQGEGDLEENRESSVQADNMPECIETVTKVTAKATIIDARVAGETRESVQVVTERQGIVEHVRDVSREEEKVSTTQKDERKGKEIASKTIPDAKIQRETVEQHVEEKACEEHVMACIEELVGDGSRFSRTDVISLNVQATPEAKNMEEEGVVGEKPCGRRVITEETTIIYKVQKDGRLVKEQVLKSVQVEGESGDGFGDLTQIYDARTIGEVKSETAVSIEREMEKFLEGKRRLANVKDETWEATMSNGKEKSASLSELAAPMETDIGMVKKEENIEVERKFVKKDFESRIPISMAKLDKDRIHKEAKVKTLVETKVTCKPEIEKELHTEAEDISPSDRKRKIETRIPKRVIETKLDKPGKKDKKEDELCEEVKIKLEKQCFAKSETRICSEMLDNRNIAMSKDDCRTGELGAVIKKELSISTAPEIIKCEEPDDVVTVSEPRPGDQRMGIEETFEKSHGTSSELSDASMTDRIKDDATGESDRVKDDAQTTGDQTSIMEKCKSVTGLDNFGILAEEELHKDTDKSLDIVKVISIVESPDEAYLLKEDREPIVPVESLEERQRQKLKEIEARTIAEALVESIESEIGATAAAQLTSKSYLQQSICESVATEKNDKLADDLTRSFESVTRKFGACRAAVAHDLIASSRQMSSMQEDSHERDSMSATVNDEDMIKDEELFQHEREESFPLSLSSSSQAKFQDRDITMSPSSISEQMDLEEVVDVDANEFEGMSSKPTFSLSSERQRSDKSNSEAELQDFINGISLPQGKVVSENSGARVLEILEPDSHSREDSVDVPSLEMDEHKLSEQTSRGIPSLHESMGVELFDRLVQERDITISPSTVSEDTNVDYSMMLEPSESVAIQRDQDVFSTGKTADSFEIASLDMISEKPKARGLEIKPVDWMIGDEKIEISETLQPSQIFNQELDIYESMQKSERPSTLHGSMVTDADCGGPLRSKRTKFVVIPVVEQNLENNELAVDKSRTAEKLNDELLSQADYLASGQSNFADTTISDVGSIVTQVPSTQDRMKGETFEGVSSLEPEQRNVVLEEGLPKPDAKWHLEKEPDKFVKKSVTEVIPDSDKAAPVNDMLKKWTETCLPKMEPLNEDYRRYVEEATDKNNKPEISATAPSDICTIKRKKDEPLPNVELSARYAITVLDQVVKKKIAEVKESLEAAKQDLIEELSENCETMIQIKDSPSEFQFKLQLESISNDLPFSYTSLPVLDEAPASVSVKPTDGDASLGGKLSVSCEAQKDAAKAKTEAGELASLDTERSAVTETADGEGEVASVKLAEEFSEEAAAITVQEDAKYTEDEHPSPLPVSISGSDVDNKDESSSLALPPRPMLKRRQKPGKSSKRVTSESDADLGSSSGESSNYLSCDYEIDSGSRPSSSDIEAMQSCGVLSATTSEYETAVMSVEHSSTSKPTSQDYYTAATTMSSRESMKSLASLSSGHLGSIDSTSELSETLVPSEPEVDNEEVDEKLNGALEDEHTERTDSSGSDMFPIDESIDKIGSRISCGMKRSSEMIFPQVLENTGLDIDTPPIQHVVRQSDKALDSATSASMITALGILRSVDIMTSRVAVDGVRSVCTQVISTSADQKEDVAVGVSTVPSTQDLGKDVASVGQQNIDESMLLDVQGIDSSSTSEHRLVLPDVASISGQPAEPSIQSLTERASMTGTCMASGVSIIDAASIGQEKSRERHSPDSDSFEMIDKPDIIDDFIVIEEVGKEAVEYDSEGKGIRISVVPQLSNKQYDRDLENLINETKDVSEEASTCQTSKNPELFDFESEESPPQVASEDQYSQSYLDDEQYGVGKKWLEMQFHADARVYDVEYDRGPLEDIKEEEITDFEPGSSRFGSLGSHKESIGSVGSMRGSFGSTPDYDILAGKKHFARPSEHDNVSLSSLQEFENLESAVAAENSRRLHCGSHDSVNNGSLPRRYMASRSGHGDDVSLSSLKDFEGLEKACKEAHLIELRAREEEDLLGHESPESKYKLETLSRARVEMTSTVGSFNTDASGSDDYEKRIKEIDEIIRIAQTNVEKFDRQDDTADDVSQIDVTDAEKTTVGQGIAAVGSTGKNDEPESMPPVQKETDVMETSTDSLEMEDNMDKKRHPLCRSSDSLEMKTTLDFPSLSSDSLNNVRDGKDAQSDVAGHACGIRRISSDSLDIPLFEQQDVDGQEIRSHGADHQSDCVILASTLESLSPKRTESDTKRDKARTTSNADT